MHVYRAVSNAIFFAAKHTDGVTSHSHSSAICPATHSTIPLFYQCYSTLFFPQVLDARRYDSALLILAMQPVPDEGLLQYTATSHILTFYVCISVSFRLVVALQSRVPERPQLAAIIHHPSGRSQAKIPGCQVVPFRGQVALFGGCDDKNQVLGAARLS